MNYHINTGLILQEFKGESECPLCEIKKIVESQIVDQFLNEAVMVDNYRKHVNEKGFCSNHTDMLFSRSNKLGLALQHSTRINALSSKIEITDNFKNAKKQAEFFKNTSSTCIICEIADLSMVRYYKTIAELFFNEQDFKKLFLNTKGFCMKHYGELLTYANYAKSSTKEYLKSLTTLQKTNTERIVDELKWFCDKHDYRNQDKPWNNSKDVLPRSIIKLHGSKK